MLRPSAGKFRDQTVVVSGRVELIDVVSLWPEEKSSCAAFSRKPSPVLIWEYSHVGGRFV